MKKFALILGSICILVVVVQVTRHHREPASSSKHVIATSKSTSSSGHGGQQTKTPNTPKPTTSSSTPKASVPSGPCASLLTVSTAQTVLNAQPTADSHNGVTSTADIITTTCTYTAGADVASVTLFAAQDPAGTSSNDVAFGSGRPYDAGSVNGYGNAAFWQQSIGMLNILEANNWYAIRCMVHAQPSLGGAEQIAQAIHLNK